MKNDIDIKTWANQIRQMKIRELEKLIAFKQEIVNVIGFPTTLPVANRKMELIEEVCRLKDKLQIITR
jgi:hypothetical protein